MDILLILLCCIGALIILAAIYFIGYVAFMVISGAIVLICIYILKKVADALYITVRLPIYIVMHPVRLCTNTKKFFHDFYMKIPFSGEKARLDKKSEKIRQYLDTLSPEERKRVQDEYCAQIDLLQRRNYVREIYGEWALYSSIYQKEYNL